MEPNFGPLNRKIGPLPLWGWGGVIVGGIALVKILGGQGRGSKAQSTSEYPTAQDNADSNTSGGGSGNSGNSGSQNSQDSQGSNANSTTETAAGNAAGGTAGAGPNTVNKIQASYAPAYATGDYAGIFARRSGYAGPGIFYPSGRQATVLSGASTQTRTQTIASPSAL